MSACSSESPPTLAQRGWDAFHGAPKNRGADGDVSARLLSFSANGRLSMWTVSLDQFVISYFLATPGFSTLPVQIYSAIRKGFTPEINAISTILLVGSMAVIVIFALFAKPGGVSDKR